MMDIFLYGEVVERIYETGDGEQGFDMLLSDIRRSFQAASAGFTIYDDQGERTSHIFFMPPLADVPGPVLNLMDLWKINSSPDAAHFGRMRINSPRRFTDVLPATRLRCASWFQRQLALTGLGHGMMLDIGLDQTRVRLFVTRRAEEENFSTCELDLLAMLGRHVGRAFRGRSHLFLLSRLSGRAERLMADKDAQRKSVFPEHSIEHRLCQRWGLSPMEAKVAVVVGEGKSRQEAAAALRISLNTLKTHTRRIYNKLDMNRQSQLTGLLARLRTI